MLRANFKRDGQPGNSWLPAIILTFGVNSSQYACFNVKRPHTSFWQSGAIVASFNTGYG
jgi:hypothetical protein